jgi:hypothetical protein
MLAKSVNRLPEKPQTLVARVASEVKSKPTGGWYEITLPASTTSAQRAETARQLRRVHGLQTAVIACVLYVRADLGA